MSVIKQHFDQVKQRIQKAEALFQRTEPVQLLAVSKKRPINIIQSAYNLGHRHFGESYVQEALGKIEALAHLHQLCWHFIGPIQSNKTRDIAVNFSWVHSIDRLKIAQRLNHQRPNGLPPLNICLQVNMSQESSKSGVSINELPALAENIYKLPNLHLRGLMSIPANESDSIKQRQSFKALATLQALLNKQHHFAMDTLSMGMSHDLESAIAEGSTIIRVGTALFGARD